MTFTDGDGSSIFTKEHINLNTIVAIVGFLSMFATFIAAWTTIQYKQEEIQKWEAQSTLQYSGIVARMDTLQFALGKQEQIDYRLSQAEKVQDTYAGQFTEIRAQLGVLTTQIAIANDSLKRLEKR